MVLRTEEHEETLRSLRPYRLCCLQLQERDRQQKGSLQGVSTYFLPPHLPHPTTGNGLGTISAQYSSSSILTFSRFAYCCDITATSCSTFSLLHLQRKIRFSSLPRSIPFNPSAKLRAPLPSFKPYLTPFRPLAPFIPRTRLIGDIHMTMRALALASRHTRT